MADMVETEANTADITTTKRINNHRHTRTDVAVNAFYLLKTMLKILIIAALLPAAASSAFAASDNAYVFGDLSAASYTNVNQFSSPKKIAIGSGFNFTENVAGEIAYHRFNNSTLVVGATSSTLKLSSFTTALVGSFPVTSRYAAIGKIGITLNQGAQSYSAAATKAVSQTPLYYAVAAQYSINKLLLVRLQYENFGDFGNIAPNAAASAIGMAMLYNF